MAPSFDRSRGIPPETFTFMGSIPDLVRLVLDKIPADFSPSQPDLKGPDITILLSPIDKYRRRPVLTLKSPPIDLFILTPADGAISGFADLVMKRKSRPEVCIGVGTQDGNSIQISRIGVGREIVVGNFDTALVSTDGSRIVAMPPLDGVLGNRADRPVIVSIICDCHSVLNRALGFLEHL